MGGQIAALGGQIRACVTANLPVVQIAAQSDKLLEPRRASLRKRLPQRPDTLAQGRVGDAQQIGDFDTAVSGKSQQRQKPQRWGHVRRKNEGLRVHIPHGLVRLLHVPRLVTCHGPRPGSCMVAGLVANHAAQPSKGLEVGEIPVASANGFNEGLLHQIVGITNARRQPARVDGEPTQSLALPR